MTLLAYLESDCLILYRIGTRYQPYCCIEYLLNNARWHLKKWCRIVMWRGPRWGVDEPHIIFFGSGSLKYIVNNYACATPMRWLRITTIGSMQLAVAQIVKGSIRLVLMAFTKSCWWRNSVNGYWCQVLIYSEQMCTCIRPMSTSMERCIWLQHA